MKAIILLGAPGAGKGTMAEGIRTRPITSTSPPATCCARRSRPAARRGGRRRPTWRRANWFPTTSSCGSWASASSRASPRTSTCSTDFRARWSRRASSTRRWRSSARPSNQVFLLEVPAPVIVNRLSGRRICKGCGAVYHVTNIPSKVDGVCDQCGGALYQRPDDSEATVLNRLEVYQRQTASLDRFLREEGHLGPRQRRDDPPGGDGGDDVQAGLSRPGPMILIKTPAELKRMRISMPARRRGPGGSGGAGRGRGRPRGSWMRSPPRGCGSSGSQSAFFGYRGFPGHIVHLGERRGGARDSGAAARSTLGDIVSVDVGVVYDGFVGDYGDDGAGGRGDGPRRSAWCAVCEASLAAGIGGRARREPALATSAMPCRRWPRPPGFRWCGTFAGTASAGSCTRIRRSPTSGRPGRGRS